MKKKIFRIIIAALMIGTLTTMTLFADDIDDLVEENEELESQIEEERARLDEIQSNITNIEDYIMEIDSEIYRIQSTIDDYAQQAEEKQAQIEQLQREIEEKQAEMDKQYEAMKKRIKYFYENGNVTFIDALFSSESIADALSKLQYIAQLTNYDREMIENLRITKEAIEANKAEVEKQLAEIENLKAAQVAQQELLDEARAQKEYELEMAYSEKYEAEEAMAAMAAEIEANEEKIAELVRWYDEQRAAQQGGDNSGGGYMYVGGDFMWPLPSPYGPDCITSRFGYRDDPDVLATGAGTFHAGLDIWAPEGTPIYAVLDGVIVANFYSDSIGYVVALYHGDGVYTEMHHMCQSSPCAVGDYVSQGDVIGYVGSTGWYVTGAHLHIGVCLGDSGWALSSNYVDPAPYLGLY